MTRAFVAIKPPDVVLDAVAARLAGVDLGDARLTPREQWHITVQFLGDDVDLDEVMLALRRLKTPPGSVRLNHAEPLGNPKRDRLLVLPLVDGYEWMHGLAGEVAARLRPLGYRPDAREFRPHLTLARGRKSSRIDAALLAIGDEPVGDRWKVDEVVVYESILGNGPAQHLPRATIRLRA